ncbi:MAG: ATP-binding protein [Rhizomicrobium sp.]|nr:ATP-binding protein [Rhizomicrobium sp.]
MRQLELSTSRMSSRWFFGNAGVLAASLLFLLTAIVLGISVAHMLDYAAKAEHAQTILHEASDLQNAISESASLTRAFTLTRDNKLLRSRAQANKAVWAHMAVLDTLLADDSEGRQLLVQNRRNLARRIALYDTLIVAPNSSSPLAYETERLHLAHLNNTQISALRDRASDDFKRYQNSVTDDMRLSMALALFSGIASPLFGLIGIHLLRRERQSQQARELQLELIHVQRLAIMGETAAMLAHEINQPLTAASNYLGVVRRLLENEGSETSKSVLERVEQQIQRAATIVRKLRRFIEKRETERGLESPDILVEDAITLLGTIDSTIDLTTAIAPDLPLVLVDRVQVQQVLVNLMRNAIEAMQGCAQHKLALSITLSSNKMIEVALADSGPGLPPEVALRLFQPFVSTKIGGMGVGLSICQSIVSQHGGRIWADANPDGGTIFRFTLPAVEARAVAA